MKQQLKIPKAKEILEIINAVSDAVKDKNKGFSGINELFGLNSIKGGFNEN